MTEAKTKAKAAAKKPKAETKPKAPAKKPKAEARPKAPAKKPPAAARPKAAARKAKYEGITFRCQWCQQERPLEEMTRLTRFSPVVIVCRGCARKIH